MWVGGDGGHSQQAGVIRTRRGLRWGTWRITPAGKRVDVAVSRKTRVHKGTWQTVTFTSNWNGRARSALSTGTLPITGSPSSKLAGVRANRVTLALGQASKAAGKSVLLVRRAADDPRRPWRGVRGQERAGAPGGPKLSAELEPTLPNSPSTSASRPARRATPERRSSPS